MGKSEYVYLEDVTFVRMKPASVEVRIDGERVYIPTSQMSGEDVEKFNHPNTKEGSTGHTVAVRKWWADTAGVEYSET